MPKITFLPIQQTYDAEAGETLLEVAVRNDVPIQHACGGYCACTTCHVSVVSGEASLSPMEDEEDQRLGGVHGLSPRSRLGCQAKLLSGDVVVEIQNLDH